MHAIDVVRGPRMPSVSAARHHNWILGGVLVVSFGLVVVLRWSSGHGITVSDWVAVILAVAAVVGYTVYVWTQRTQLPVGLDQAGDNAYYIGLVLTFTSLAVALVKLVALVGLGQAESAAVHIPPAERIAQLIPDFGVALASTIAGIVCRLFLQQQNLGLEDARQNLDEAVREFGRRLRIATREINDVTISARIGIAKNLEEAAKAQVESFDRAQEMVRNAAEAMAGRLQELTDQVSEATASLATELVRIGDARPGARVEELTESVGQAKEAMTELREESAALSAQIAAIVRESSALSRRLAELAPEEEAARMRELVQGAVDRQERLQQSLAAAQTRAQATGQALEDTAQQASEFKAATGRVVQSARSVEEELEAVREAGLTAELDTLRRDTNALQGDVQRSRDHAESVARTMQGLAEQDGTVQSIRSAVSEARDQVGEFTRKVANMLGKVEEVSNQLDTAADRGWRRLFRGLRRILGLKR